MKTMPSDTTATTRRAFCVATGALLAGLAFAATDLPAAQGDEAGTDGTADTQPASGPYPTAYPSTCSALHVEGTHLMGEDGKTVQLRGVSTHGLAWFPAYVNDACFAQLRDEWGAGVVRLALYTAESSGWCTDGDRDSLRALVDEGVRLAAAHDMYAIVDWHILSDTNPLDHLDEALAFFDEVSRSYADQAHVIYEICNEPNGSTTWADVKSYAETVIPVIRANAPDALILVGTPTWSQRVDEAAADPLADWDNVLYVLHFYAATHTDDLRATMAGAVAAGLPVFVSEFGVCDASGNGAVDLAQADAWVALMDELGVSYVMWNLSNKDESSAILLSSCAKTADFADEDLSEAGLWLRAVLEGTREADANAAGRAQQAVEGAQGGTAEDASASEGTAAAPAQVVSETAGLTCAAALRSSWESDGKTFLLFDLTVTNESGTACDSWTVNLAFTEVFELSDGWNGAFAADGSTLCVSNADYNGHLDPGASVTDVGVIVAGSAALALAG